MNGPTFYVRALNETIDGYTQMTSKIGFCRRRTATEFWPACIAQLIQVELLRRRQSLAKIQGASLAYSQFLKSFVYGFFTLSAFLFVLRAEAKTDDLQARIQLRREYESRCREDSDIHEHIPVLYSLAKQCSSVVEIGLRFMNSTWGILQGLADSSSDARTYLGIDLAYPPLNILHLAKKLAKENGIAFYFLKSNDMSIDLAPADLLFIDSLHTYCHLTYELETFSPQIRKFIAMHDTSYPWGTADDIEYTGNYSEYPIEYDRTKSGLWAAVEDFLERHPEWKLRERRFNNYGFTILERVER